MNIYIKTCEHCKTPITSKYAKKFCNSSCAASYNNSSRLPRTTESKKLTSASVKQYFNRPEIKEIRIKKHNAAMEKKKSTCTICGVEVIGRKTCSTECYNKHQSVRQTALLKNPEHRKKYRGNSGKSYMEESFDKWLSENYGGKYFDQIHFFNEESRKHGWIDFLFPKEKIIIELDGTHHRKRENLDNIRDEYLKRKRGYTVYRITIYEYQKQSKLSLIKQLLNIK